MIGIIKILKKMNVGQYKILATNIYSHHKHEINKYFDGKESLMIGGGNEMSKFTVCGTEFNFYKIDDNEMVHYHLFQEDKFNKFPECIYIIIDKIEKHATLHGITYDARCFTKNNKIIYQNPSGSTLLDVSLKVIKKLQKHYNLKHCTLLDNSEKKCAKVNINFALMYTLINGDTWYGARGFVPKMSTKERIDKKLHEIYQNNKKIMDTLLVKNVPGFRKYLLEAYDKIKPSSYNRKSFEKLYDDNLDKKLCDVIGTLLIEYDKTCSIFNEFYIKLATGIGIYDFYGKSFIMFFK